VGEWTAGALARAIASGERTSEEVVGESISRIRAHGGRLGAFYDVFEEQALESARSIDTRVGRGETVGPLAGVPVALKDNLCLAWGRTTCGSRFLEGYESPYTATAVRRLLDAGAVVVGKTAMDEFAMGSSCEHCAFGSPRNPWDEGRVPGGSSGGSAIAVASRMVPVALGSDTGGSIRQPAGFCGVVGMKPTYGRVSRYGLVAFASSLDQIGPFATSVGDCALMLSVLSGFDPLDSTSVERGPEDFRAGLDEDTGPLKIGVPVEARSESNHPGVNEALERAVEAYKEAGAEIVDAHLPSSKAGIAAYYIVAPAEASSNLARFDGVRYGRRAELADGEGLEEMYCRSRGEGFGHEVKRRIMLGTHVLSSGYYDAYYNTALKARRKIRDDYDRAWANGCDALLMPSSPHPAFRVGAKSDDPLALYLEDVYTVGVNLAGLPGITVPGGFVEEDGARLPVGMQLVGPAWSEAKLFRVARVLERAVPSEAPAL